MEDPVKRPLRTAAIMQPHFLPFAGYFDLMQRADVFVLYDIAQFRRRSWHSRTWIRQGKQAAMLTAPVHLESGARCPLDAVQLGDDKGWHRYALRRLKHVYGKLPMSLELLFKEGPPNLVDWNEAGINWLAEQVGVKTHMLRSSQLAPPSDIDATAKLVWMCRRVEATRYLATPGSKGYIDETKFESAGITVVWLNYDYRHTLPDESGVKIFPSLLDLLLAEGSKRAELEVGRR